MEKKIELNDQMLENVIGGVNDTNTEVDRQPIGREIPEEAVIGTIGCDKNLLNICPDPRG